MNRKEENSDQLRPDAAIKYFDSKFRGTTLGFCEVKPSDSQKDVSPLCIDFIRLAVLSRNIMLRKSNQIACALQAVGKIFNIVHMYIYGEALTLK